VNGVPEKSLEITAIFAAAPSVKQPGPRLTGKVSATGGDQDVRISLGPAR